VLYPFPASQTLVSRRSQTAFVNCESSVSSWSTKEAGSRCRLPAAFTSWVGIVRYLQA